MLLFKENQNASPDPGDGKQTHLLRGAVAMLQGKQAQEELTPPSLKPNTNCKSIHDVKVASFANIFSHSIVFFVVVVYLWFALLCKSL